MTNPIKQTNSLGSLSLSTITRHFNRLHEQRLHLSHNKSSLHDDDQDDDDPHRHIGQSNSNGEENNQENKTSNTQAMMHILKANIGTGVLAMPGAFKNVGLWLGFIMVPLIGLICIHCMNILVQSHNRLCDRFNYESLDYDQVAALSLACGPKLARQLAKYANVVVTIFLMVTQLGFCCVYTLFVVNNIQVALLNLFGWDYSTTTYLLLIFPIIGLASCTSNLRHLARISILANILQSAGLALILFDLLQFHTYSSQQQAAEVQVDHWVSPSLWSGLPLYFATSVYAFEGIGVVLPLAKEMESPQRLSGLNGVLNTSMSLVALLYMAIGFFGYAKYGQLVASSITLNLPQTTLNEAVRLTFAIAIGLSYSLQFYVPWTIVWPLIDETLFYSYRPRAPRDKLTILNKLSAENEWAIDEKLLEQHQRERSVQLNNQTASMQTSTSPIDDQNSTASTYATSYATSCPQVAVGQYGAISQQQQPRSRRNRLEDLVERDYETSSTCSSARSLPDVQWRPPPSSMRGKRKLVRYTVILVTVAFTFVAAALIPRLDLFISLIGALASSCLAIIFPALIQTCTFWRPHEYEDQDQNQTQSQNQGAGRSPLGFFLFLAKNCLLLLFGLLGLVTGSWVSLSQLADESAAAATQ